MQSVHKIILAGLVVFIAGGLMWYQLSMRGGSWQGHQSDVFRMGTEMDPTKMHNRDMSTEMMSMMSALSGKTGDAFDRAFLEEMIKHHQGAIDMAGATLKNAERKELKDMARNIITAQKAEIEQMRQWQEEWYGVPKPAVVPETPPVMEAPQM